MALWQRIPSIQINLLVEEAIREYDNMKHRVIYIYTDSSRINSYIRMVAITLSQPKNYIRTKRLEYISIVSTLTVYTVKLKGLILRLQIMQDIQAYTNSPDGYIIFTDNQAMLKVLQEPKCLSRQYILIKIVKLLDKLQKAGQDVQFYQVLAYVSIADNKAADQAAKEAADLHSDSIVIRQEDS